MTRTVARRSVRHLGGARAGAGTKGRSGRVAVRKVVLRERGMDVLQRAIYAAALDVEFFGTKVAPGNRRTSTRSLKPPPSSIRSCAVRGCGERCSAARAPSRMRVKSTSTTRRRRGALHSAAEFITPFHFGEQIQRRWRGERRCRASETLSEIASPRRVPHHCSSTWGASRGASRDASATTCGTRLRYALAWARRRVEYAATFATSQHKWVSVRLPVWSLNARPIASRAGHHAVAGADFPELPQDDIRQFAAQCAQSGRRLPQSAAPAGRAPHSGAFL